MSCIDDMTIAQARELVALFGEAPGTHSLKVGQAVLIRTVTYHYTGRIKSVTASDIVLQDAAWIADTGRFSVALEEGFDNNAEIEPYPNGCTISRAAIVDVSPWPHALPREVK